MGEGEDGGGMRGESLVILDRPPPQKKTKRFIPPLREAVKLKTFLNQLVQQHVRLSLRLVSRPTVARKQSAFSGFCEFPIDAVKAGRAEEEAALPLLLLLLLHHHHHLHRLLLFAPVRLSDSI